MRTYCKLKRNNDFTRLYRSGRSQKAKNAVILVRNNRLGATRVGFSVSKKIGNAVKRKAYRKARIGRVYLPLRNDEYLPFKRIDIYKVFRANEKR